MLLNPVLAEMSWPIRAPFKQSYRFDLELRNRIRLIGWEVPPDPGSRPEWDPSCKCATWALRPLRPYKPRLERSTLYILQPVSSLTFTRSSPNPATPKLFKGFRSAPKRPSAKFLRSLKFPEHTGSSFLSSRPLRVRSLILGLRWLLPCSHL